MAKKKVNIGPFGPFIYEATKSKAVETDGDIEGANFIINDLTTNVRKLISNANRKIEEVVTGFAVSARITSVDSPYTAGSEEVILVDASGGDIVVNLPDATTVQYTVLTIKRVDTSQNIVTIDASGTQLVEDEETKELLKNSAMKLTSDNSQWWII